jgi:transcriptional regulator with XRE-family HTH domain
MENTDKKTSVLPEIPLHIFKVGKKITVFREKKGILQKEMAEKLGMTERAYLNIEKDKNKTIDLYRIQEIAHILEVDFWDLIEKEIENTVNITHNKPKGNNNCNFYSSPSELAHQNEKLQIQLESKDKEIAALQREIQNLKEINALLKSKKE